MMELPSIDYCPKFLTNIESWHGHVFFVRDLIHYMKPSTIVELGVHKGDSLFSMAESCAESNLKTRLYGIDHWQGDTQAGHVDDEIYDYVKGVRNKHFNQVKLIQSSFNDATEFFKKSTVDILHIDGFHTYEASKNDFVRWLPKVKSNGIILIHDIASENENFGVVELWKEIRKSYTAIEFKHSQGLGVMFNREFPPKNAYMKRILDSDFQDSLNIYYSLCSTSLRLNKLSKEASYPYERQMFGSESLNVKKAVLEQKKLISMPKFTKQLIELWQKF